MGTWVDIHCHLLPGLDDGPETLEESLQIMELAHRQGVRHLAATPHLYSPHFPQVTAERIRESFDTFRANVDTVAKDRSFLTQMSLYPGAEHHFGDEFLKALQEGQVITLNSSRYLLVEFSVYTPVETIVNVAEASRQRDLVVIVAHVERYASALDRNLAGLDAIRRGGGLLQVNASTVLSAQAGQRKHQQLLRSGLIDLVASDAHGIGYRKPNLGPAADAAISLEGVERAHEWLQSRPAMVLDDQDLSR